MKQKFFKAKKCKNLKRDKFVELGDGRLNSLTTTIERVIVKKSSFVIVV